MAAAVAFGLAAGSLRIQLVDGSRQPLWQDCQTFLRLLDNRREPVHSLFVNGPTAVFSGLPSSGNGSDPLSLVAHAPNYYDALLFPIRPAKNVLMDAALMLVPRNGRPRFHSLDLVDARHPRIRRALGEGCDYRTMQETNPRHVAAALNVFTALEIVPLPDPEHPTPLDYDWVPDWHLSTPSHVWAWVDIRLMDSLRRAAELHSFAKEPHPESGHPGISGRVGPATSAWKETRFDVGNLRFSFHEHDRRTFDLADPIGDTRAVDCVMVEVEIDCWGDLVTLGRADLLSPPAAGEHNSPELVYQLRWMSTRLERLPEFDPPYTIEAL